MVQRSIAPEMTNLQNTLQRARLVLYFGIVGEYLHEDVEW
jgi:hypothetical protein